MATRDDILVELGLTPTWRRREAVAAPLARLVADVAPQVLREPRPATSPPPAQDAETRSARIASLSWDDFAADVDACTACGLCRTRNKAVPGVGDTNAGWLFVGEAPGAEEDARGEPFVGQAGRLLDNMLAALGMARGRNVYIANVLKCRPPGNRNPESEEVATCSPHLVRQIELIQPKLILAMGRFAVQTLLNTGATIASLRGKVHQYHGVPLIVTYHPAYLLRNLPDKAKAWADLVFARKTIAGL
jgi:DNA polymerase